MFTQNLVQLSVQKQSNEITEETSNQHFRYKFHGVICSAKTRHTVRLDFCHNYVSIISPDSMGLVKAIE